jgi:hypothetical protein
MENERKLLEEVIDAWYTLGHLGGYNTLNFQVPTEPTLVCAYLTRVLSRFLLASTHTGDEPAPRKWFPRAKSSKFGRFVPSDD